MKFIALVLGIIASFGGVKNVSDVEIYAKTTVVIEVNYEEDKVVCADFMKRTWSFEGCEDWMVGDIASLLLHNNGTKDSCFDDVVLDAKYDGWIAEEDEEEKLNEFFYENK